MRSLQEIRDKLKDVKKLRDQLERPAADAALSVARTKDAHVHNMERLLHAPERAKRFEQDIHRRAGHKAQSDQIDVDVEKMHKDWQGHVESHKVNEKRLQDEKHLKHAEYARHNKDVQLLRGMEKAHGVLKPEHLEFLKVQAKKSLSAGVSEWLQ